MFSKDRFTYEAEHDVYHCLSGQALRFRKHTYTERTRVYWALATNCTVCALNAQCTRSPNGRQLNRSFDEACLERVRAYHPTEGYRKAMRKRKVRVEPLFAEAKDRHGLRRFRQRRLEKGNREARLIAAGQNVKRLLTHSGWGRRLFPSGAAGIVLPALLRLPAFMP